MEVDNDEGDKQTLRQMTEEVNATMDKRWREWLRGKWKGLRR